MSVTTKSIIPLIALLLCCKCAQHYVAEETFQIKMKTRDCVFVAKPWHVPDWYKSWLLLELEDISLIAKPHVFRFQNRFHMTF